MVLPSHQAARNNYLLGFATTRQEPAEPPLAFDPARAARPAPMVMVDAAADVSSAMASHAALRVLPLRLHLAQGSVIDKGARDVRGARTMGRARLSQAWVEQPGEDALEYRLYPNIALNADHLIMLGTMGEWLDIARPLRDILQRHYEEIADMRRARGLPPALQLDCIDTRGVLAVPALHGRVVLRRLDRGESPAEVARAARAMPARTLQWLVPRHPADLAASLARLGAPTFAPWADACRAGLARLLRPYPVLTGHDGRLACDRHFRDWNQAVALALDQAGARLRSLGPGCALQISLDGSIRALQALPAFARLQEQAAQVGARAHVTHMSLAGRAWASAGSMSVAVLAPADVQDSAI